MLKKDCPGLWKNILRKMNEVRTINYTIKIIKIMSHVKLVVSDLPGYDIPPSLQLSVPPLVENPPNGGRGGINPLFLVLKNHWC